MKIPTRLRASLATAAVATLCLAGSATAAITVTSLTDIAPAGVAGASYTPTTFTASSTDLVQGMTAAVTYTGPGGAGSTTNESSAGVSAWTNGSLTTVYATSGAVNDAANHAAYGTVGAQTGTAQRFVFVTYDLGSFYNLSQVNVFTGWNDSGRDDSSFNVLVSTDNLTFSTIATYTKGPDNTGAITTPVTNLHSVADDGSASIATGIRFVQIQFTDADNGYAGVSEIDVLGTAVPEAGSTVLGLLGGLLLIRRKRN
jgi:hypothetical protein